MALLTVQTPTAAGATPSAATQLSAWASPDTISGSDIGDRGVVILASNTSGGSLDLRVSDPGSTPAGNTAANGYTTVTVPTGQSRWVYVGRGNVNAAGVAQVGASTTNAAFTVQVLRY